MSKSSEILRDRLEHAFKEKVISKLELHHRTKIGRPSIDGYLKGAVPDLDALDRIAAALGQDPWELIKPAEESPSNLPTATRKIIREITDILPLLNEAKLRALLDIAQTMADPLGVISKNRDSTG